MSADAGLNSSSRKAGFDLPAWLARYGTLASLAALVIVFSLARSDVFPTVDNLLNIMNQVSILGTMAFGLTVCLVMGLFDLSIAAMATLGGYVATFLLVQHPDTISVPLAVLISLAIAGAIGVFNGLIVSYLGISAFIAGMRLRHRRCGSAFVCSFQRAKVLHVTGLVAAADLAPFIPAVHAEL